MSEWEQTEEVTSLVIDSTSTTTDSRDNATNGEKEGQKDANETNTESMDQASEDTNYELIDGTYYYTDGVKRFMYDTDQNQWVEVDSSNGVKSSEVTTDAEGRQYYYAEGMYLCRDTEGHTFYMDEKNEWKPWESSSGKKDQNEDGRWFYYYQGEERFYRDNFTSKVYKYNSETSDWEEYKSKKRKKTRKVNEEEEFDTSEEGSDEEDTGDGEVPPGWMKDPSISHDGKVYIKHDQSDNTTYEWEPARRAWFPKVDDDFMANYQLSYGFNPDGTKNLNPVKYDDDLDEDKEDEEKDMEDLKKKKGEKKQPGWFEVTDEYNPRVYVSNLPLDLTLDVLVDFMQKCGLVFKDPETQQFKIKMYKDPEGNFKGDALCTYIKVESVELALQILDGARLGSKTVKVERAKFEQRGQYDPSLKPKKRKKKDLEKIQRTQEKLLAWHPDPVRGLRAKHENTVILRNVFNPSEFEEKPEKLLKHKEAIRLQAETFGKIKKIELFDRHPEGVVKVAFVDIESADMCSATLNNRMYLNRMLRVETWDGREQFLVEETEEQKQERLKKWDKYLEEGK